MRPIHVAKKWQHLMAMLFTNGSYFWIYDLVEDNSFTRDEEGMALLKKLISLRTIMLRRGKGYLFCDDDGIVCDNPSVTVKRFIDQADENRSFLAVFRLEETEARVRFAFPVTSAVAVYYDGSTEAVPISNGELTVPKNKACLIFLNER